MTAHLQAAGTGQRADWRAAVWLALAVLAVASVLIVNGRPFFYFDTVGYVDQGNVALSQLGLIDEPHVTSEDAAPGAGGQAATVRTVDGSRSPFYSLMAGIFSQAGVLEGLLALNGLALFLSVWLVARVAVRTHAPDLSAAALACLPLIVASMGSLPFYAAYLMPDLLAPVMIIVIATLTAYAPKMRGGELALAFLLGAVAIVSHLSHFAIGGLMALAALVISPFAGRRRWWIAPAIAGLILGAAWAQQQAFRVVAKAAAHSEVVLHPYITARLIEDGPGLAWLDAHCPDPAVPTCALHASLRRSDEPGLIDASHIIFEKSERLGSFRLLPADAQKRIADDQIGFFLDVLKERPVATTLAFLGNTLVQSSLVSIDMTVPTDKIEMRNAEVAGALSGPLRQGRLASDGGWIGPLVRAQETFYVAALAIVLTLLVLPGGLPGRVRVFGVMVLLGILANALVCGGISQPATRYGARMVWLVPFLATFLVMWSARGAAREAA